MAAHGAASAPYEYHLVFGAHPDEAHFIGPRTRAPHVARVFVDRLAPADLPRGEHHDLFVQHDFNHTWSLPGAILDAVLAAAGVSPWAALRESFTSLGRMPDPADRKKIPFVLGFFHKVYFDWAVSKFVTWSAYEISPPAKHPFSLLNVFGLLRPGGSLYMPGFRPLPDPRTRALVLTDSYYAQDYLRSVIDQLPLPPHRYTTPYCLYGSSMRIVRSITPPYRWEDARAYIPADLPEQLLARTGGFGTVRSPAPVIELDFFTGYPASADAPDARAYPDIGMRDRVAVDGFPQEEVDAFEYARIVFHGFHQAGTPLPALPMKF
jgi:hypothetical protein